MSMKQYKYTVYTKTRYKTLFTKKQADKIKDRIEKAKMDICTNCGIEKQLIFFDDENSLCENCADTNNLI